jgi:sialate O-acetylesterase
MKILIRSIAPLLVLFIFQTTPCQVRLPRLISDGMVLQRGTPVLVWGWAAVGEHVSVSFNHVQSEAVTDSAGKWAVRLPSMPAGGPYTMTIDATNHIQIRNMLIGDVWVCAGQSNMVLPMERVKERYPGVIERSENEEIRQFLIPNQYDFNTVHDDLPSGRWESANPETVPHFSATAYFFARALFDKYHVPIGLINASVGGTPVESWLSEDALKAFPEYFERAQAFKDTAHINSIRRKDQDLSRAWYTYVARHDAGVNSGMTWYDTLYDASGWSAMQVPSCWDEESNNHRNGTVWFRKEVNIPASFTGKPVLLKLGRIVDWDSVYVNGRFAGSVSYQYPPRRYELKPGLLKPGKNIIVIRIINTAGQGGFIKDKPYQLVCGEQTIDLTGEWRFKVGVMMDSLPPQTFIQYQPVGLFNGMISPVLKYAIKGVIWYQGESNTSKPADYYSLFPTLIRDWRKKWNQGDFPFLYVQLANYLKAAEQPSESKWAELREAQFMTLALPNTGMAVTIDLGEWNDVHPLNKEDVGRRLALSAERLANGEQVVFTGPVYDGVKFKGNKGIIRFTGTGSGLIVKGGGELKEFAIAGKDKKYVWARASISGNRVIVWSDAVAHPVSIRYAWADNPQYANLFNKEGLPASPFRTNYKK